MPSRNKSRSSPAPGLSFDFDDLPDTDSRATTKIEENKSESEINNISPEPSFFAVSIFALSGIEGLGHKGIRALDSVFGITNIWSANTSDLSKCLSDARLPAAPKIADDISRHSKDLLKQGEDGAEVAASKGIHVVAGEKLPESLRGIPGAPRWLFVQGNVDALYMTPTIALVGTRKPSPEGLRATGIISELLSPYPINVVSGLAEGIDEQAHYDTLQRHKVNVAFLGHGINFEFPSKTVDLRRRIVDQGGAVATEYLPAEKYQRSYFVERNRLQAGLATSVIPIEATATGGTSHTVRFAQKYKRHLIGIRWPGANGILADLEHGGASIFDIFTSEGRKALDAEFKGFVTAEGGDAYPLSRLERRVLNEFKLRNARPEDIAQFIKAISNGA